jgi:hypothetical protein
LACVASAGGKSTSSSASSSSPDVVTPSKSSSRLTYLTPVSLATFLLTAVVLFALIFFGELALGALLRRLFEFVFAERVRSLDHAINQLEEPLLLHSAILLFQLFLCSLLSFFAAWVCSNFLLSMMLSGKDAATSSPLLDGGATIPTILMLSSMGLIRLACFAVKVQPTQRLLLQWNFPFSARVFDSLYYSLLALSIYAAVSVTTSIRRIELLEKRTAAEEQVRRQQYLKQRAQWEAQQLRNAETVRQAQQIVAASKTSPAKQKEGATVAAGAAPSTQTNSAKKPAAAAQ